MPISYVAKIWSPNDIMTITIRCKWKMMPGCTWTRWGDRMEGNLLLGCQMIGMQNLCLIGSLSLTKHCGVGNRWMCHLHMTNICCRWTHNDIHIWWDMWWIGGCAEPWQYLQLICHLLLMEDRQDGNGWRYGCRGKLCCQHRTHDSIWVVFQSWRHIKSLLWPKQRRWCFGGNIHVRRKIRHIEKGKHG